MNESAASARRYGIGAAHDAAQPLRARLRRASDRERWLCDGGVPFDEMLLALALRIQRSANRGCIERSAGFDAVLRDMARGAYGPCSRPAPALTSALEACLRAGPAHDDETATAAATAGIAERALRGDLAFDAVVNSLLLLRFIDDGL